MFPRPTWPEKDALYHGHQPGDKMNVIEGDQSGVSDYIGNLYHDQLMPR